MGELNLGSRILQWRKEKFVTQGELASFLGVTKAAVSKWESGKSYPDIQLLPQIATFFGTSIDELVGYEPQLTKSQREKYYALMADKFAKLPFETAMIETRQLLKKFYSCYPFVLQVAQIWLNHFMLCGDPQQQKSILEEIISLCDHVLSNSTQLDDQRDAVSMRNLALLTLNRPEEVITSLEARMDPARMDQHEGAVLIQAYLMAGKTAKANENCQLQIYHHLLELLSGLIVMLTLYQNDAKRTRQILERAQSLVDTFQLPLLHTSGWLQFEYQAAVNLCVQGEKEEAMNHLQNYQIACNQLVAEENMLHGDDFFDQIDGWFQKLPNGKQFPRSKGVMIQSLVQTLDNPVFTPLKDMKEWTILYEKLENIVKGENHGTK